MKRTVKNLIIILFSLTCWSCAKNINVFSVDSQLMPYYQSFIADGKARGRDYTTNNLVVRLSTMSAQEVQEEIVGYCKIEADQRMISPWESELKVVPTVTISKEFFLSASEEARINLIYHELGHCVLKRNHDESMTEYGYPKSFMYPNVIFNPDGVAPSWSAMISAYFKNELFNPTTPAVNPLTLTTKISEATQDSEIQTQSFSSNVVHVMTLHGCLTHNPGESHDSE